MGKKYSLPTFLIPTNLSDEVFTKDMNHLTGQMGSKFFVGTILNVRHFWADYFATFTLIPWHYWHHQYPDALIGGNTLLWCDLIDTSNIQLHIYVCMYMYMYVCIKGALLFPQTK